MVQHRVDALYAFIENRLIDYGLSPQYAGFYYLAHAIHWSILDKSVSLRLCNNLYPRIAKPFGISVSAVEHGIRNLLSTAWRRHQNLALRNLFSTPPTNARCIALMTRIVRTQYFLAKQRTTQLDDQEDRAPNVS